MLWNSKNWLIAPWMILFIQATKDRQSVIHNFPFLILEIKYNQIIVQSTFHFDKVSILSMCIYLYISAGQLSSTKYAVKPGINPYPV